MLKRTFDEDLQRAIAFHGHMCAGQVIGCRMARLAMEFFHIEDPDTYRDLIAFVECDRCLADAVISVANCHLGRRRLKWYDYGIMAASFYDIASGRAIRITQRPGVPKAPHDKQEMLAFFAGLSDDDLCCVNEVELADFMEYDRPGRPRKTQVCEVCGERVHDGRGVERDGHVYCRRCAGEPVYYKLGRELSAGERAAGA